MRSSHPADDGIRLDKDEKRSLTSRASTEYPFNIVELFGLRPSRFGAPGASMRAS
jgi:hypothetical protein